jgi:S-adenosylmethionine synthetase
MYRFSEYVSPGHPDKVADYISEYILDRYVEQDPNVRYGVEVMVKGLHVYIAGEVTSTVNLERKMLQFVKEALNEIGYTMEYAYKWGLDHVINPEGITVHINITSQSPEISQGVDNDGWGDQGIFFGYADPDGDEYMMPKSHSLAKSLCYMLYNQAKNEGIGGIDIKTEVVLDSSNGWIEKIIAAVPCRNDEEYQVILESIKDWYNEVEVDIPFYPEIILNGTGNYTIHGPIADCGVTGRKLAVDFYGGEFQVGGGSPWTKDVSKADLALNLYARKMAIDFAKELKEPVKVSLACCIGKNDVNYSVNTPCGDEIESGKLTLKPNDLKLELGLNKPIYASMCKFGLFGEFQRDKNWEK